MYELNFKFDAKKACEINIYFGATIRINTETNHMLFIANQEQKIE
jgi:hypothetical protein